MATRRLSVRIFAVVVLVCRQASPVARAPHHQSPVRFESDLTVGLGVEVSDLDLTIDLQLNCNALSQHGGHALVRAATQLLEREWGQRVPVRSA